MSIFRKAIQMPGKAIDAAKVEVAKSVVRGKVLDFARILSCKPSEVRASIEGTDEKGNFVIKLYKGQEFVKEITLGDLMF